MPPIFIGGLALNIEKRHISELKPAEYNPRKALCPDDAEYQKISKESSNADRPLNTLKYLTNWYSDAVKKNPGMVDKYEEQSDKYVEEKVKNQKLDNTFTAIKTDSKSAFLESLRAFQISNPDFLSSILKKELALQFWNN